MQALASSFGGLALGARPMGSGARRGPFVSNGNAQKTSMKKAHSLQVEIVVGQDEPQDVALKRFRREVMNVGVIMEVRRRRYFETPIDIVKRKQKEKGLKNKLMRRGRGAPVVSYGQVAGPQQAPFADLFGSPDDIFSDALNGDGDELW